MQNNVLCVILGGGQGKRLYPLTQFRSKPAVPFAGQYRLVDIPISNCLNSGLTKIFVLTQFNSHSLNRHIGRTYRFTGFIPGFVDIIAAEQSLGNADWFQGTADAVRRTMRHFTDPNIHDILILSGDQLYAMDLIKLLEHHKNKNADITISGVLVGEKEVGGLGIMQVDLTDKIIGFFEKPRDKKILKKITIPCFSSRRYLASMGIYVFKKHILQKVLDEDKQSDFGRGIIPATIYKYKVYAYRFGGFWKDLGTIKEFYNANLLFTKGSPPINLFSEDWRIFTRPRFLPPAKVTGAKIRDSIIANGCWIGRAEITNSVIGLRSVIGDGCKIKDTVLMGNDYFESLEACSRGPRMGIGQNCEIKKAIIDKNARIGNNVKIINKDKVKNFQSDKFVIKDGIIVVNKNALIRSGQII
ncbi:MAG: glucose-1-phosphate adenylyltransferase [Candidatus Omnitrophota bacterium]